MKQRITIYHHKNTADAVTVPLCQKPENNSGSDIPAAICDYGKHKNRGTGSMTALIKIKVRGESAA